MQRWSIIENIWAKNMNFTKIMQNSQNTKKLKLSSIQNMRKLRTSVRNLQETSMQKYKGTHGYRIQKYKNNLGTVGAWSRCWWDILWHTHNIKVNFNRNCRTNVVILSPFSDDEIIKHRETYFFLLKIRTLFIPQRGNWAIRAATV